MKHITLKSASLALAACFSTVASAGVEVSTALSGLRYHLVDLDLNDGIAAAVTFNSPATLFTMYDYSRPWGSGGTPVPVTGRPFEAAPTSFDGGPGEASGQVTANGYRLAAAMQTSQLLSAQLLADNKERLEAPYATGASLHGAAAQASSLSFDNGRTIDNIQWTLAPNTALVVEGVVDTTLSMDLSDLDRSLLSTYVDERGGHFDVSAYAFTQAYLGVEDDRGDTPWQSATSMVDTTVTWGQEGDAVVADNLTQPMGSKAFSFRVDNTKPSALSGHFGFGSMLFASASIKGLVNEPVSSVPEPTSMLQWGLGLLALRVLTRRRQRP